MKNRLFIFLFLFSLLYAFSNASASTPSFHFKKSSTVSVSIASDHLISTPDLLADVSESDDLQEQENEDYSESDLLSIISFADLNSLDHLFKGSFSRFHSVANLNGLFIFFSVFRI